MRLPIFFVCIFSALCTLLSVLCSLYFILYNLFSGICSLFPVVFFLYVSYHHTQSVREKLLSRSEDALSKRELPKSNSEQMQFNRVLP